MKPILFNTAMVRAILAGRKTQTRRLVKPQPDTYSFTGREYIFDSDDCPKPPCKTGDVLYVRETWAPGCTFATEGKIFYKADDDAGDNILRWCPSIHMPKEAARIFLRVTDVLVERLQTISLENCISEGAVKKPNITKRGDLVLHSRYRNEFAVLWNSTIKPTDRDRYGWDANPWVWVICFERIGKEDADG